MFESKYLLTFYLITISFLIGFRRLNFNDNGEIDKKQDMEILDFLLGMCLLARVVYDKKLRSNHLNKSTYCSDVWIMRWWWRRLYASSWNSKDALESWKNICQGKFKSAPHKFSSHKYKCWQEGRVAFPFYNGSDKEPNYSNKDWLGKKRNYDERRK